MTEYFQLCYRRYFAKPSCVSRINGGGNYSVRQIFMYEWTGPKSRRGKPQRSYHQHLMKVLFKLVNVGVRLQALSICHHASQHELIILFH